VLVWAGLGALALTVLAILVSGRSLGAGASVLSRGAEGWLAAHRYLQDRGTHTRVLDQELETLASDRGVLVITFPWQHVGLGESFESLNRHLRRGGTVVLAYTGELEFAEIAATESVGLHWEDVGPRAPLNPWRWWTFASRSWSLRPEAALGDRPEARIGRLPRVPRPPRDARVLYRYESGHPAVFAYPSRGGRVVVLPAQALANARLANAGNADLLETLRRWLGPEWTFDEFHHGLMAPSAVPAAAGRHVLDAFLAQLGLLYGLGVLALSRRFGPPWSEPPVVAGSTRAFLLGLGRLHHRLGHHREAIRRLRAHARELFGHTLPETADDTAAPSDLMHLARALARPGSREATRR
jgi:uncharacterized protein DUF4350